LSNVVAQQSRRYPTGPIIYHDYRRSGVKERRGGGGCPPSSGGDPSASQDHRWLGTGEGSTNQITRPEVDFTGR